MSIPIMCLFGLIIVACGLYYVINDCKIPIHKDRIKVSRYEVVSLNLKPANVRRIFVSKIEMCSIDKIEVKHTMVSDHNPSALVLSADGMEHVIKVKQRIGKEGGVVKDIKRGRIYVDIEYKDSNGNIYVVYKVLSNRDKYSMDKFGINF